MFNAFKRTGHHRERNPTGLGLGLHIAREIVSGHSGTITYEYMKPHVVFTVTLPIQQAAQE